MIGIFNCGGDLDHYDNDYDDSLFERQGSPNFDEGSASDSYGREDDVTLRQYRGRAERPSYDVDDRSATEKEMTTPIPSVEELGDNLRALAMRRMLSQRVAVRVGARRSSADFDDDKEAHVAITHHYTIRRPRSFLSQQSKKSTVRTDTSRGKAASTFLTSEDRFNSGIPKEICIELDRWPDEGNFEQRSEQEREENEPQLGGCDREPVENTGRPTRNHDGERQEDLESMSEARRFRGNVGGNSNDKLGANNILGGVDGDIRRNGLSRPPLPDAARSKHVRVRIRKPLGIVFEALDGGSVRIVDMPTAGNAARCGRLAIWDELVSINGKSMKRRSFDFVMDHFERPGRNSKLDLVFRRRNAHALVSNRGIPAAAGDRYEMPDDAL